MLKVYALMFAFLMVLSFAISQEGNEKTETRIIEGCKVDRRADGLAYVEGDSEPFTGIMECDPVTPDVDDPDLLEFRFVNGKANGPQRIWRTGAKEVLRFEWISKDDRCHGHYKYWNYHGNLTAHKRYENGVAVGEQKRFHSDGGLAFLGTYWKGLQHGKSTVWYENGKIRNSGMYYRSFMDGEWVFATPSGEVSRSVYDGKAMWKLVLEKSGVTEEKLTTFRSDRRLDHYPEMSEAEIELRNKVSEIIWELEEANSRKNTEGE